jgi:hypothetical protein
MLPISRCRALLSLIALFVLTQPVQAQSSSVPVADSPYEWEAVTTASRKMLEVQRETNACVVNAIPQFLQGVATEYEKDPPVMYGAMEMAGGKMAGRGPESRSNFATMYHVTSAGSFYKFNVSKNWKEYEAEVLSKRTGKKIEWDSPEVFAAWKELVTDGKDIPTDTLDPHSVALRPLSWVSPDRRMVIPTASNRKQGTDDFFKLCHVLSLAPEWYADGLVNMHYGASGKPLIRPVSFDGMLSPLWVQRPPDQHAATGGDALEAFNKEEIRISEVGPLQAYIVTAAMTAALKNSPLVVDYAVDLDKVARGADAATQRLGQEEASIVRQVRASRRAADAEFVSVLPTPIPAPHCDSAPQKKTMLPLPSGRSDYASLKALEREMTAWAVGGYVQNRGQRFPSERFAQESAQSAVAARAIVAAATALLRSSDDTAVLTMAAELGSETSYRPYYVALLDRLAGRAPPLPAGPGIRTLSLRGDLLLRLEDRLPAQDKTLFKRAYALAARLRRPDIRLALLLSSGAGDALVPTLADAARMRDFDPWLAARAGWAIARHNPQRLAAAASTLPTTARRLFVAAASIAVGTGVARKELAALP